MPKIDLKGYRVYGYISNDGKRGLNTYIYKYVYNTSRWRRLRLTYLVKHPICEICQKEIAVEVHHKQKLSTAKSIDEMKALGFNSNNLMALCADCHKDIHRRRGKNGNTN